MLRPLLIFACAIWVVLPLSAQETDRDPDAKLEPNATDCRRYIEIVDAEDGRSEVVIVWAHGYYSAARGVDEQTITPITWKTVGEFAERLAQVCRKDPQKLFISAVKEMK